MNKKRLDYDSQESYCAECVNVDGCNVILGDNEECGDKAIYYPASKIRDALVDAYSLLQGHDVSKSPIGKSVMKNITDALILVGIDTKCLHGRYLIAGSLGTMNTYRCFDCGYEWTIDLKDATVKKVILHD